jgi:hypothetical protein
MFMGLFLFDHIRSAHLQSGFQWDFFYLTNLEGLELKISGLTEQEKGREGIGGTSGLRRGWQLVGVGSSV